ncbi:MAG: branched-chain amino acid ABC transporter permease [Burkholderiales bacterium]|nr:branched-chain amino acid ABC transporter permease [Burkholderiales bacterium]
MKRLIDPASVFPALASMAGITLFAVLFLHAESQEAVLGLSAGAVVILLLLARFGWNTLAAASFAGHSRTGQGAVVIGVLIIVAAFYDQHFPLLMLATVLLYIVVCLGLNLQFGYAGVVNFAGAAFFGIGCYTAAVLAGHTALPHLLVVLAGGVMAAVIGSLLILPVLRTYGHYAALVTIAFSILFRVFIEVNDALGGPQGMRVPGMEIFGWQLNDSLAFGDIEISFYANYVLLALAMAAVAFMLVRRLERSWIGLNLDAVRLDETACAAFGIDVARWKITAFTLGNFLAGLAGSVYAMMTGFVAPNAFTFGDSLILVSIVILGGIGNPWGLTVAAAIVLMLPEKLQFIQEYRLLLYAGLVILILLFRPGGLMPRQVRNYLPGWKP